MPEYVNAQQNVLIEGTVSGAGVSSTFNTALPYRLFTVQVTPTGGTVSVAASNDGLNWADWDSGSVSASTIDTLDPVRFVKVTNGTSTSTSVSIWGTI